MRQRSKLPTWLILASFIIFAVVIILFFAPQQPLKRSLGVSPYETRVIDLIPGGETSFELTIYNNDAMPHNFTFSTYHPQAEERRADRAAFPNASWIRFSEKELGLAADSEGEIEVNVAIPPEPEYAGKDYEIWLGITTESEALVTIRLYARLLVSTIGVNAGYA